MKTANESARNTIRFAVIAVMIVNAILMVSAVGDSSSANAATSTPAQVVDNGIIRVESYPSAQMSALQVGVPADWDLLIESLVPSTGNLDVGLALTSLPADSAGLDVEVLNCSVQWVSGTCPTGASTWTVQQPVATAFLPLDMSNIAHRVGVIPVTSTWASTWLRLRITPTPAVGTYAAAEFLLQLEGQGEPVAIGPGVYRLGKTGADPTVPAVFAALLVVTGALMLVKRRATPRFQKEFRSR